VLIITPWAPVELNVRAYLSENAQTINRFMETDDQAEIKSLGDQLVADLKPLVRVPAEALPKEVSSFDWSLQPNI
jgi:hypothetical protein